MTKRPPLPFKPRPYHAFERSFAGIVCGIDEAGRGPLAGPVVAAAVVLTARAVPKGIKDSKLLKAEERQRLHDELHARAHVGIGQADVEEIDRLNILHAAMLAMKRAVEALPVTAEIALVDGNYPPKLSCVTHCIIQGDRLCLSIGAASIIAKVTRDRLMHRYAEEFPDYGFERHVGYSTAHHLASLSKFGPSPIHRRSFAPVRLHLEQAA